MGSRCCPCFVIVFVLGVEGSLLQCLEIFSNNGQMFITKPSKMFVNFENKLEIKFNQNEWRTDQIWIPDELDKPTHFDMGSYGRT